jgi:hypothetical protein
MVWSKYFAFTAFLICLIALLYHFIRLIRLKALKDYSRKTGDLKSAIAYSYIGAMAPTKKESAYLHLPTYVAGLLYHLGTFTAMILFFIISMHVDLSVPFRWALVGVFAVSVVCGSGILMKRIFVKKLRSLSNPDDYISNILVTLFQLSALLVVVQDSFAQVYFIYTGLLFLYVPLGKLKHVLYFFSARYHLGFFYGWRGIWPLRKT